MNNTAQHDFGQFFVATSMQLRRDIEDAGKQLKEALTEAGQAYIRQRFTW